MQVNIVDELYSRELKSFNCNATHHLPRVGEDVVVDSRLYTVAHVVHNVDDVSVRIIVEQKY